MGTCRPYLLLGGTLADTHALYFASDRLELLFQVTCRPISPHLDEITQDNFTNLAFQHKNLGILTTLRIGVEDAIGNGRWLIDHIVVRNEVTGRAFK